MSNHTEERKLIVEIAKHWKGHEGVDFESTTTKNLLLLIRDALKPSNANAELIDALKDAATILQQVGYIHTARQIEQLIEKSHHHENEN